MADLSTLPYRPCVGIMLINHDGLVFVGQRKDSSTEAWQMPQGGIDEGEEPLAAAFRELAEEAGTDLATPLGQTQDWLTYDLPAELVGQLWGGRYRGQKQIWFAMRFEGTDEQINIDTLEPEFVAWRWTSISTLVDDIVPFKRALYTQVIAALGHFAVPDHSS